MTTTPSTLCQLITAYLRMRNLTQKQLAERANVSRSVVSRIISTPNRKSKALTILKIAKALDIPAAELYLVIE